MNRRKGFLCVIASLAVFGCAGAAEEEVGSQVRFNITAPTLGGALLQFGEQARLQLIFATDGTEHLTAPRVAGMLTPRAALEQLLSGSGLKYEFVNVRTVSITREPIQSRH